MLAAVIFTLIATHITIVCVTLYLHRSQAHKGIVFNPVLAHFMRFWLWLTTGMVTKEWVAIHRKHHSSTDKPGDPHSPVVFGIWKVLFGGAFLYAKGTEDKRLVQSFGVGTPDDWVEQHIYTRFNCLGILLMLLIDVVLFDTLGVLVWAVQMIWIPFWAAGVINGIGHKWGYTNGSSGDSSKNIFPLGILIGGECLHNNHHLDPANPKLSRKWWEFDAGWAWFKVFQFFKLAKLRQLPDK